MGGRVELRAWGCPRDERMVSMWRRREGTASPGFKAIPWSTVRSCHLTDGAGCF